MSISISDILKCFNNIDYLNFFFFFFTVIHLFKIECHWVKNILFQQWSPHPTFSFCFYSIWIFYEEMHYYFIIKRLFCRLLTLKVVHGNGQGNGTKWLLKKVLLVKRKRKDFQHSKTKANKNTLKTNPLASFTLYIPNCIALRYN